ncbi:MAG: hypothetical protein N4A31_00510 [Rickettsiales bacterium]|jgi:hypothetical protein|nr:hypothetical protein [Rickettsiales bacterium]
MPKKQKPIDTGLTDKPRMISCRNENRAAVGDVLQFLRDEVNDGKMYMVPTFKAPSSPEEARKIETNALTIRYEKIHGKESLKEALKEKFPEKYGKKSKGSSFSERAAESRELRGNSGRGSK